MFLKTVSWVKLSMTQVARTLYSMNNRYCFDCREQLSKLNLKENGGKCILSSCFARMTAVPHTVFLRLHVFTQTFFSLLPPLRPAATTEEYSVPDSMVGLSECSAYGIHSCLLMVVSVVAIAAVLALFLALVLAVRTIVSSFGKTTSRLPFLLLQG